MSQKLVHFSHDTETERYRAEFYIGGACIEWKYLTNDEWVGLSLGEVVDFMDLPKTYVAEPLLGLAENQCLFDDDENNFMSILREFAS